MSPKNIDKIRLCLRILTSVLLVISGILLIYACVTIYKNDAYSRETATAALDSLMVPLVLTDLAVLAGFIFEFITNSVISDTPNRKDNVNILKRIASKKDVSKCDITLGNEIKKERKTRKIRNIVLAVITVVVGGIFIGYLLNGNNFGDDINASVINAMRVLVPCVAAPFIFAVYTAYSNDKSMRKEIELLKQAPNGETVVPQLKCDGFMCREIGKIAIAVIAVGLLIYGYASGGIADVLTKAVNICTECIGLG